MSLIYGPSGASGGGGGGLPLSGGTLTGPLLVDASTGSPSSPLLGITAPPDYAGDYLNISDYPGAQRFRFFTDPTYGATIMGEDDIGQLRIGAGQTHITLGLQYGNPQLYSNGFGWVVLTTGFIAGDQLGSAPGGGPYFMYLKPIDDYTTKLTNDTGTTYSDLLLRAVTTSPLTVATLPNPARAGMRSFVTDASQNMSTAVGQVVSGGGSNDVPVYYDGSNWIIG